MKVLMINGSPKRNGVCNFALETIGSVLKEEGIDFEIIQVSGQVIAGCLGCGYCMANKKCVQTKDFVNEVGSKCKEADGFIFASPTYYAGVSGQLKSLLDRLYYAYGDNLSYKPGAAIASARRAGTLSVFDDINKYFSINNQPIVTSNYWNNIFGNSVQEAKQDEEGIFVLKQLGHNMAYMLKALKLAEESGLERKKEKRVGTNFIR